MPKMKTNSAASKRVRVTGSGKLMHAGSAMRHNLEHKSARKRRALKADGVLVFDVFSPGQMAGLVEGVEAGRRLMGDFWAEDDYFALKRTFVWPAARISLERYLVLQPDRRLEIYNWMQYYTPASIAAELAQSGYVVEASLEVATGLPWQESPTAFVVLARPQ